MTTPRHALVVLAAGGSRRLGEPKQLLLVEDEPLVRRAALAGLATDPAQALVVVGASASSVWGAVADLRLTRVDCPDWSTGLSASIRAGLDALDASMDAALFVLCDQPALNAAHLGALVTAWRSDPGRAVASGYAATLGVPAVLPRGWFSALRSQTGDRGARDLLRARAAEVRAVPDAALARGLDRRTDVDRLRRRSSRTPDQ